MTTATGTAAEAVARILADHPDGLTAKQLAEEAGISQTGAQAALKALADDGTATRTAGPTNGGRKTADVWRPTLGTADAPAQTADDGTDPAPGTPTGPAADDHGSDAESTSAADEATDETADEGDEDQEADDPEQVAPTTAVPHLVAAPPQVDLKVQLMAQALDAHPDGATADTLVNDSGLAGQVAEAVLLAMEVAGAAHRPPVDENGLELWLPGDADLATVNPAEAPAYVLCHTCGQERRVRRGHRPRMSGGVRISTPESNGDGAARLGKNELRNRVEAVMRGIGPDASVTPGMVANELRRSSGAVLNAMHRLTEAGVLNLTSEKPVAFALTADAPAPEAAVADLIAHPIISDPDNGKADARTA